MSCLYSQCEKNDLSYKTVAISVTASTIDTFAVNSFKEFYGIISPLIQTEVAISDKMDVNRGEAEIEEERSKQTLRLDLRVTVFKAIGVSWPRCNEETQCTYLSEVCRQLSSSLPNNNWRIQEAILNSFVLIITRYRIMPYTHSLLYNVYISRVKLPFNETNLKVFSDAVFPNLCQCTGQLA